MASKVKKNYLYNLFYQILLVIVPIITTPYVSRVLGSEKIGIWSFTASIVTYFALIGSLGVGMYGQREIARYQDDVKKRTEIFWQVNIIKWITMSISLLIYYFTCIKGSEYSYIYFIMILEILSSAFDISWYFQGLENFKTITIRNTIIKIISVICIFIFVNTADDLPVYVLIHTAGNLLGNLSLWAILPKYINKAMPKIKNSTKHLVPILLMFLPQIAIQVYTILDKTMLGFLYPNISETGIYEQSQKIVKITLALVTSLGTVMAPRIASLAAKNKTSEIREEIEKAFHLVWLLALPICFGIIAIAPNIVPWFLGEDFLSAISVMQIGALLMLSIGLNNVTGIQYLVPVGKEKLFTLSVIIGAITNLVGNFILIPILGANGAIISSVTAETIIFIAQMLMIHGAIQIKDVLKDFMKPFLSTAIMFIIIFYLGNVLKPNIINTALIGIIGVVVYGIMSLILKESWVIKYKDKFFSLARRGKTHE